MIKTKPTGTEERPVTNNKSSKESLNPHWASKPVAVDMEK